MLCVARRSFHAIEFDLLNFVVFSFSRRMCGLWTLEKKFVIFINYRHQILRLQVYVCKFCWFINLRLLKINANTFIYWNDSKTSIFFVLCVCGEKYREISIDVLISGLFLCAFVFFFCTIFPVQSNPNHNFVTF